MLRFNTEVVALPKGVRLMTMRCIFDVIDKCKNLSFCCLNSSKISEKFTSKLICTLYNVLLHDISPFSRSPCCPSVILPLIPPFYRRFTPLFSVFPSVILRLNPPFIAVLPRYSPCFPSVILCLFPPFISVFSPVFRLAVA